MNQSWESSLCVLCDVVEGQAGVPYEELFPSEATSMQILLDTSSFIVVPDIGPIVEGYCLIISKRHVFAMSQLSKKELAELYMLKECVKNVVSEIYDKKAIVYEHGEFSFSKNAGACIDHAHLHIVPTNVSLLDSLTEFEFSRLDKKIVREQILPNTAYLYYEDITEEAYFSPVGHCAQQYFRRKLVSKLGTNLLWNWRDYVRLADVLNTRERIKNCISKLQGPLRIQWASQITHIM